jgi:hypothetical protein
LLAGWLANWPVGRLACWPLLAWVEWLAGWLAGWLAAWLAGLFAGWLACLRWLEWLSGMDGCLASWLPGCPTLLAGLAHWHGMAALA